MWTRPLALALCLAACRETVDDRQFPKADRDIAPIVGDSFSTEDVRDRLGEFTRVVELAGVKPGMWVADVGSGEGYYAIRLAEVVGPRGRVLAEDIVPEVRNTLAQRVQRENLDNVAVVLGLPDNPKLPARSFDRIFLVHMYHEVTEPYAFLWHLRDGLKPGGAGHRRRCRPAAATARLPAGASAVRVRSGRPADAQAGADRRCGCLFCCVRSCRRETRAGQDRAL